MTEPVKTPLSLLCAALDRAMLSDFPPREKLNAVQQRLTELRLAGAMPGPEWAEHVNDALYAATDDFLDNPQDAGLRRVLANLTRAALAIDNQLVSPQARIEQPRPSLEWWQ